MQPAQQYGIKIAQPGYDARTCKDYDLIFNSSWPSIAIVLDQTQSIKMDSSGNAIIAHNLGFVPLTMAWEFTDSTMAVQKGRVFPAIDKTNIYFIGYQPNATYYMNLKCYNLDITKPQLYNYLQAPAVNNTYDPTYGIKVAKQNLPINSNDMRNFILHSRCASPQVLAVVTDQVPYNSSTGIGNNNNTITYTNPQGYTPWAFGYAQTTDIYTGGSIYKWAAPVSQTFPALQFNVVAQNTISLQTGGAKGSIVILRDPLFAPNSVQAVY